MSKLRVAPKTAEKKEQREEGPGLGWTVASIQGRIRGIASAFDSISGAARFADDSDGWLHEVLVAALEREADRLTEIEIAFNTHRPAVA
jgi:hypothetical protein